MAKIIHSSTIDVIDHIVTAAKEKGTMHICSEEQSFDGNFFKINGKMFKNFGTCGYLGLETHPLLIEGAIDLIKKFGTQLSISRAYLKPTYIQELEELISLIFNGNKAVVYTSTSTAHLSVIGTIIKPNDMIILDQQVHYSVQYPCMNMKLYGTEVQMVRHSNYDKLEELIIESYNKYNKIWYMSDGVYSMFGDLPDTDKLKQLMDKYPKLHLYFDDAHGMSWSGPNGAGYVFEKLGLNERIVLISTLAKGFGCVGGTAIFSDIETFRKVDIYGGALSYTHPLSPANVGAAIASAKIHLSSELISYQNELQGLMQHMNSRLENSNLTNISSTKAPIYFIGAGNTKVTLNLVDRILSEGIYVNTSTFPVVPNDKTGLRFTITRHNNKSDIDELADALAHHLPLAITEEHEQIDKVYKKFNIAYTSSTEEVKVKSKVESVTDVKIEVFKSIKNIDSDLWDSVFKDRGTISHNGLKCMEEVFSNNSKPEENWEFYYVIIKDNFNKLICATFFTSALLKDDLLAPENVSRKIEKIRETNPYYLCSQTLIMGSLFAEGDFLYLDETNPQSTKAVKLLMDEVENIKQTSKSSSIIFRDFAKDNRFAKILENEGFAKVQMPNTNILTLSNWTTIDEMLNNVESKNNKNNIKRYALKYVDKFDITVKSGLEKEEADKYFELFNNIKSTNFGMNFFIYPAKVVEVISKYKEWEFIHISLKGEKEPVACVWSFKGENHYSPLLMGLDYKYLESHQLYKQTIYQVIKRANDLKLNKVYMGYSADFEKQKYGAKSVPIYAYMKVDDTYNMEVISSFSNI